jgi:hypothetical protein
MMIRFVRGTAWTSSKVLRFTPESVASALQLLPSTLEALPTTLEKRELFSPLREHPLTVRSLLKCPPPLLLQTKPSSTR